MVLAFNKNLKDPATIGDLVAAFKTIPPDALTPDKILYGTPGQRPQPFKLKGYLFIDYITPAAYISIGTSWVDYCGGSGGTGNVDGGNAYSVYTPGLIISGGGA